MIDPADLRWEDVGRRVRYTSRGGETVEIGTLSSWRRDPPTVFVRFRGPQGNACRPEDVSFEGGG